MHDVVSNDYLVIENTPDFGPGLIEVLTIIFEFSRGHAFAVVEQFAGGDADVAVEIGMEEFAGFVCREDYDLIGKRYLVAAVDTVWQCRHMSSIGGAVSGPSLKIL